MTVEPMEVSDSNKKEENEAEKKDPDTLSIEGKF